MEGFLNVLLYQSRHGEGCSTRGQAEAVTFHHEEEEHYGTETETPEAEQPRPTSSPG